MVVSAKNQRVKQEETPMMQQYQGIKKVMKRLVIQKLHLNQ